MNESEKTFNQEDLGIIAEYEDILEKINYLAEKYNFWNNLMENQFILDFLEKSRKESDEKKLSWINIKPAEFSLDQARVRAIEMFLNDFESYPSDVSAELSTARGQKTRFEDQYALLLASAGYEVNQVPQNIKKIDSDSAGEWLGEDAEEDKSIEIPEGEKETPEKTIEERKEKIRKTKQPAGVGA